MEHAWFRVNCGFAACCFAIALFAGSGAHAQTPVVTGDAAALTREAGRMLDDLQIPNEVFEAAAGKLLQAITLDPGYAKAYVQLSRLEIMGGLEMGRRFAPMSVETAEKAVVKALDLDPSDGYAWVLKAHLYVDRHRLSEAKAALIRAEKAGTDSPWLMLNWAEVFEQEGDLESAAERYQAVLKSGTVNKRALRYAYRQLTGYYILKRDWENAEQMHLAHKQIDPYDAWAPTNFAASLARAGQFARAIPRAREALRTRDYEAARRALAIALFGQWATSIMQGENSKEAAAYLSEARTIAPNLRQVALDTYSNINTRIISQALIRQGLVDREEIFRRLN